MGITERLRFLINNYFSGNVAEFARKNDLDRQRIQSYFDTKSKPSFVVLANIVENTGCDARWLLTGKGSAFQNEEHDTAEKINALKNSPESPVDDDAKLMLNLVYDTFLDNKRTIGKLVKSQKSIKLLQKKLNATQKQLDEAHKIILEKSDKKQFTESYDSYADFCDGF